MVQRDDTLGGSRSAAPSPSTSDLETPNATSSFGTESGTPGSYGTVGAPPEPHRTEGAGHSAREQVRSLASEVRDQAKRKGTEARDQVGQMVGQQKTRAAERLTGLAGALRQAAGNLQNDESMGIGRAADSAAGQIDRLAGYLRDRDLGDLVHDAETMARRHPDVFLGATFLSGLLLARFLKSSADRGYEGSEAYAGAYGAGSYDTGSYGTGSYGAGSYGTGSSASGAYEAGTYGTGAGSYGTGAGSYGTGATGTGSYGQGAGSGSWGTGGGAGTTDAGATGTAGTGATGAWGTESAGSPIHTYNNATVDTGSSSDPAYNATLDNPPTGAATDATSGSTGKTGKRGGV
jgi:uncharacterized protein YjbJ (UPF0337 family)